MPKNSEFSPPESGKILDASIAHVQEHGDIIDNAKWLHRPACVGNIAVAGAGLAGFQIGPEIATHPGASMISGAIVMGGALVTQRIIKPVRVRKQKRNVEIVKNIYDNLSDNYRGDSLEIYTESAFRKPSNIHLVWEPLPKNQERDKFTENLLKINEDIKDLDIKTVSIPHSSLKAFSLSKKPETRTRGSKLEKNTPFNLATRALLVGDKIIDNTNSKDPLCVFTKPQLQELAKDILSQDCPDPLDTYMELLKGLRKRHPSLKFFKGAKNQTKTDKHNLAKTLENSLSSKLDDTDFVTVKDPNGSYVGKDKISKKGRVHFSQKNRKPKIDWKSTSGQSLGEKSEDLMKFFGITEQDLLNLPNNIGKMTRNKATIACEIGAYLSLKNSIETPLPKRDLRVYANNDLKSRYKQRGMQTRLADRLYEKNPPKDSRERYGLSISDYQGLRVVAASLGLAALAVAGIITSSKTSDYNDAYYEKHAQKIEKIAESKIAKNPEADIDETYRNVLGNYGSILFRVSQNTHQARNDFRDFIEDKMPEPEESDDRTQEGDESNADIFNDARTNIGDVNESNNKPVWQIKSFNGMKSEGYWSESTSSSLQVSELSWHKFDFGQNLRATDDYQSGAYFNDPKKHLSQAKKLPKEPKDISNPYLYVQKKLNIPLSAPGGLSQIAGKRIIDVPILENTEIVAARLNGSAGFRSMTLENGRQILIVGQDTPQKEIEYWLAPKKSANKPRFVEEIVHLNGPLLLEEPSNLESTWKSILPESLSLKGLERINAQSSYLRSNFKYKLDPFNGDKPPRGMFEYLKRIQAEKTGNCNTINTFLAISNPKDLNTATGFRNSNTSQQIKDNKMYLSTAESHLWTVDKKGDIHDATPALSDGDYKDHFSENFTESTEDSGIKNVDPGILLSGGMLGLIALGSVARISRRKIIKRNHRRAVEKLETIIDKDKEISHEVFEHILFSGKPLDSRELNMIKKRVEQPSNLILGKNPPANQLWKSTAQVNSKRDIRRKIKVNRPTDKEGALAAKQALKMHKLYKQSASL